MISLVFLIYIKLAIELYPEWQSISFSIEENSTRSCSIKLHFSVGFVCSNSVLDSSLHFYYIYRVCIWFKFFLPYSFHFLLTHKNGEVTGKFTSVRTRSLAERNIFLKKRNFETVQSNVIEKKRVWKWFFVKVEIDYKIQFWNLHNHHRHSIATLKRTNVLFIRGTMTGKTNEKSISAIIKIQFKRWKEGWDPTQQSKIISWVVSTKSVNFSFSG